MNGSPPEPVRVPPHEHGTIQVYADGRLIAGGQQCAFLASQFTTDSGWTYRLVRVWPDPCRPCFWRWPW